MILQVAKRIANIRFDQNQASHLFQLRRPALAFVPAGNRKESGGPDQLPALQLSA